MDDGLVVRNGEVMRPGRRGGLLRNGGGRPRKSVVARAFLEAKTLAAAKALASIALDGKLEGYKGKITLNERVKALGELLARGGVPQASRQELTGSDGAPFVVAIRAARDDE